MKVHNNTNYPIIPLPELAKPYMRSTLVFLFCLLTSVGFSQKLLSKKYYKDKNLTKEAEAGKGKYILTTTKLDGITTIQAYSMNNGSILFSKSYKGKEPHGIWIKDDGKETVDYNFDLVYSDSCGMEGEKLDEDALMHLPLVNGMSYLQFISANLRYPQEAIDESIQGRSILCFEITPEGKVQDLTVKSGGIVILDKEAARVVRMMEFTIDPEDKTTLTGRFNLPVKFYLR